MFLVLFPHRVSVIVDPNGGPQQSRSRFEGRQPRDVLTLPALLQKDSVCTANVLSHNRSYRRQSRPHPLSQQQMSRAKQECLDSADRSKRVYWALVITVGSDCVASPSDWRSPLNQCEHRL